MIHTENLYSSIILKNAKNIKKFRVITGYSSGLFIERVLQDCPNASIELYIGMALQGISKIDHLRYIRLSRRKNVNVFYVYRLPNVHQKIIEITDNSGDQITYVGSANFSENGFGKQSEILTTVADDLDGVFKTIKDQVALCSDKEILQYILLTNDNLVLKKDSTNSKVQIRKNRGMKNLLQCDEYLKIPLLRKEWRQDVAINAKIPYLDLVGTNYGHFFEKTEECKINFRNKTLVADRYGDFGKRLYFKNVNLREFVKKYLNIRSEEITFEDVENTWILIEKNMFGEYNMDIIINIDGSDEYFTLD